MKDSLEKLRHILYRLKSKALHQSKLSAWLNRMIWNQPTKGLVEVVFKEDQNIQKYFNWDEIEDPIGQRKLRDFTERYAEEPNVVYQLQGEIIIEPDFGLAIGKGRQLFRESNTLSHPFIKPNFVNYIGQVYFKKKFTEYDFVIHSDGFAGINLCHFIYDTINPIIFLVERGLLDKSVPILVSEKVYRSPWFQYVLQNTSLGSLPWITQRPDEWVKVKKLKKVFVSMEIFHSTYKILDGTKKPHRRIFLNRRSKFQRNLKNIDGILAILKENGFEEIYSEDLPYTDQVKLFREVHMVVGIHGAGLTNLLHADIPSLRVLEIFSETMVHASFYRFLKILNVGYYDAIVGDALDINWNHTIDEEVFRSKVRKLISVAPDHSQI